LVDRRWHRITPVSSDERPNLLWFTASPRWLPQSLLIGAIGLIPFVGLMNLYGWALTSAANLRAGYRVAAPARLAYVGRGAGYVLWSLLIGFVVAVLAAGVGIGAGVFTFSARHDWVWTIAIGLAAGLTVTSLVQMVVAPLMVPVLRLIDDVGLKAAFSPGQVARALGTNWDAAWLGVLAVLGINYASGLAATALSAVPVIGSFAPLLVMVPAIGLLGLVIASPLANAGKEPRGSDRTVSHVLAAGFAFMQLSGIAAVWALSLGSAVFFTTYSEEVACFFQEGCNVNYAGTRETITRTAFDPNDTRQVSVTVTFVNRGSGSAEVDPDLYWVSLAGDRQSRSGLSTDCPPPPRIVVGAHSRATQVVCFRLLDSTQDFSVHLPWTGWNHSTPTRPAGRSPSPTP
jgi:hypothetical protein